jgi:hypothetical protein
MDGNANQTAQDALIALIQPTRALQVGDQAALYEYAIWAVTLASAKIPFATLSEEDLPQWAEHCGLLILPRVAWLDDEEIEPIKALVEAGHNLLITADSGSCRGPRGQFARRSQNALAGVAGAITHSPPSHVGDYLESASLRLTADHPATRTAYSARGTIVPLWGRQYGVRAGEAESLAHFIRNGDDQQRLSDALLVTDVSGGRVLWFVPAVAQHFSYDNSYVLRELMLRTVRYVLRSGVASIWYWRDSVRSPLVIDGDVDHPPGVDPECARYVSPAIEALAEVSFDKYGIYVSARNLEEFPACFPASHQHYYNHSYSHPYSYWDEEPWAELGRDEIRHQIQECNEAFLRLLGQDDQGIFRLPHFQLEKSLLTFQVLDEMGYAQESSVGSNYTLTAGFPFHPSREPWSGVDHGEAHFKCWPEQSRNFRFLEVPISYDPTCPGFPNGFCSYNTLGEGVRNRTASPDEYLAVFKEVIDREYGRGGLIHVFADPPDVGYGVLAGDQTDYSQAVKDAVAYASGFEDIAFMSPRELVDWWLAREKIELSEQRAAGNLWEMRLQNAVPGTTLCLKPPEGKAILKARSGARLFTPKPLDQDLVLVPLGELRGTVDVQVDLAGP